MARKKRLRTPDEVKRELEAQGLTIAGWARANGLRPRHVYDVLSGRNHGKYGTAHDIAVLLGIKDGVVERVGVQWP